MKFLCTIYVVLLTLLLAVKDPFGLFGMGTHVQSVLSEHSSLVHLVSFFALTLLALAAHWPIPNWFMLGLLCFYAVGTEILQGFLPKRVASMEDFFANLTGIGLGCLTCWLTSLLFNGRRRVKSPPQIDVTDPYYVLTKLQNTKRHK